MNGLKKLFKRLPSLGGALDRSSKLPQLTGPISETSSVIVNPPSSGTSLTIEELDGDPSVSEVSKLIVPNDSLTDNDEGTVTLEFGAALNVKFWRQDNEPTPIPDVTNYWYKTNEGVDHFYDEKNERWIDYARWA